MKGVAGSVKLKVDCESTMCRAKVAHSYAEEGNQLYRCGIGKGIVPSRWLEGMMRQACEGAGWLVPLASLSPEVAPALLEHAFDGRHIGSISIDITNDKASAFRPQGMIIKASWNDHGLTLQANEIISVLDIQKLC